jgi:hypothetical protein
MVVALWFAPVDTVTCKPTGESRRLYVHCLGDKYKKKSRIERTESSEPPNVRPRRLRVFLEDQRSAVSVIFSVWRGDVDGHEKAVGHRNGTHHPFP